VSEAEVGSLPVMTKADLMDNFDDIVTDRRVSRELCEAHLGQGTGPGYLLGEYSVVASGGSSGQRGVFVYGWDAWAICYASIVRFQQRDWARDPSLAAVARVTAVVAASSATHLSAAISRTFSAPRSPRQLFPVSQPIQTIVAGLNDLQPTILMCYSSFLPHLAAETRAGRLAISPRRVIAISEPLLPEVRAAAAAAWAATVANGYGMSEGLFAGCCPHGIHLPDDLCLIEPVDAAARGSPSQRIYVTNLYNHTLPLVRFEVTDELTESGANCPCGSALRRIQDPLGRLDDTFVYRGGLSVHPHLFRSALGRHPQVIEYQVRQTERGADIQLVVAAGLDTLTLKQKVEQLLAAVGLHEPAVTVTLTSSLDRQASGKLRWFVPLPS
jgi:phenylacetate-CoA ligase